MSPLMISVVICTHNRDYFLGDSIDSVLHQDFANYEVVVVDNASTDKTRQVVEERLPHHSQLRYIYEPTLGLNVARNRGLQETIAPIIVYFDDDAIAPKQWLKAIQAAFETNQKIGVAGGKVDLIWPPGCQRPQWLSDGLAVNLGAYDLGDTAQAITDPGLTPRGLNYAIRRDVLQEVGGFSLNLDRVGTNLLSNGDLYMTEMVLNHGYQVVYLPEAIVQHKVSPERMHLSWYFHRGWWQGVSEYYREQLAGKDEKAGKNKFFNGLEGLIRGLVKSVKYINRPDLRLENLIYAYSQLGYLKYLIQGSNSLPVAKGKG